MPWMPRFTAGSFIRFTYNSYEAKSRFKEVLVLCREWRGKMHGIDLQRLTSAEVQVLEAILDPKTREKQHAYPLVNDILRRMDPNVEIRNPVNFYQRFVKVFLRDKDAYRTYYPGKMVGVSVIKHSKMRGQRRPQNPLFKKPSLKPATGVQPKSDLGAIKKQRAAAKRSTVLGPTPTSSTVSTKSTVPTGQSGLAARRADIAAKMAARSAAKKKP